MTARSKRVTRPVDRPTPLGCKIDWYSFTIPTLGGLKGNGNDTCSYLDALIAANFSGRLDPISPDGTWRLVPAKGFYQWRATHVASGVCVSWGEVNAHVFIELPGQACSWAREAEIFDHLIRQTHERASRLDCAVDITTKMTPGDFVAAGYAVRFAKNTTHGKSETGETYYVGNRKGERFARVYRYNDPHPRAAFLRVETQFGGKAARQLASLVVLSGTIEAIRSAHAVFDWHSSEMTLGFLQLQVFDLDRPTSPVTESIGGLLPQFYPRSNDTIRTELLTLFAGLRKKSYRRYYQARLNLPGEMG